MVADLVDVVRQLATPEFEQQKKMLDFLYEALTILDRKADALMAFNAILVAAAAFAIERGGVLATSLWRRIGVIIVILTALGAAALNLGVARVKYGFLAGVTMADGKPQLEAEFKALAAVLADRTLDYQIGWWLSLAAVFLSAVLAFSLLFARKPASSRPIKPSATTSATRAPSTSVRPPPVPAE
ncbi:MAG TPA: hypothetical protein VFA80_20450 [Xanthobacteraceae bacterium]|jgi:hypothetical protein|nr:hypothetical protein [Xanthobacteraceae bacterium]